MTEFKSLKPYLNKDLEYEWGSMQLKYRNFLKRVCTNNGYELKFMPNHYEFSAFIKNNEKYVYVSISDVRYFKNSWYNKILIRTAKSYTDYCGGVNNYVDLPNLETRIIKMLNA